MIRSSRTSLKFLNKDRSEKLKLFLNEYRSCVKFFIDLFWEMEKVPVLVSSEIYKKYENDLLTACVIQAAAKQASGVVRGIRSKNERLKFVITKLISEGKTKDSQKLQKILDKNKVSKPKIGSVNPELGKRYLKFDLSPNTKCFDGWIVLSSIFANKSKIMIPFRKTKHFNKLKEKAQLKEHIRISESSIDFLFESESVENKASEIVGLDVGLSNVFTTSNKISDQPCNHGHTLKTIVEKLSRKKKGSKAFGKAQKHRLNFINWSINEIAFEQIKVLRIEKIKNLRKNQKTSRKLSHWNYKDIFGKLKMKCQEFGVQVQEISPTFTSQRCHRCSWTQRKNRNGKVFRCAKCSLECDADLNGAINISLINLPQIRFAERQSFDNKIGFYWHEIGKEPIVPFVQKSQIS